MAFMHITLVLEVLMFRPVCLAKVFNLLVFSCRCCIFEGKTAKPLAKSRYSSWEKKVH